MNEMVRLRDYVLSDADAINDLAVSAFSQYCDEYDNWKSVSENLSQFSSMGYSSEIVVATSNGHVVGAVAYIPSSMPRANHFPMNVPIISMLVVAPSHQGLGIGKQLLRECLKRAIRDGSKRIALHTSPIMKVALSMYKRYGFIKHASAPKKYGIEYNVFIKELT